MAQVINIQELAKYFRDKPVLKAYLFGSYVSGEANDASDVDILVELDYHQKIGLQFITMKIELEKLLRKPVDLVSSNGLSPLVKPFIEKNKLLIYEATEA